MNIYLHPTVKLTRTSFQYINSQISHPCLIMGDLNAHHPLWGCEYNDAKGKFLYQIFLDANLVILNTGETTRFSNPMQKKSAIDLALVSASLAAKCNWFIINEPGLSDHFPAGCVATIGTTDIDYNRQIQFQKS